MHESGFTPYADLPMPSENPTVSLATGITGGLSLSVIDSIRAEQVRDALSVTTDPSTTLEVLQHVGNLPEGFFYTAFAYAVLQIPNFLRDKPLKKTIATTLSTGAVAAFELGIITGKEPDPLDIPISVAGSVLFFGILRIADAISKTYRKTQITKRESSGGA